MWWTIPLGICVAVSAWLTCQNNQQGGLWFWALCAWSVIPFWAIISRYSRSLIFDSLLFDIIGFSVFSVALIAMGHGQGFTVRQWAGLGVASLGVFLMRV